MNRLTDEQLDNLAVDEIDKLSDEQIEKYREAFSLFENEETGTVPNKELSTLMYYFGQTPSEHDLKKILSKHDNEENGAINFSDFVTIIVQSKMNAVDEDKVDLAKSFQIFDKDNNG